MRGRTVILAMIAASVWTLPLDAQSKPYKPTNGVLNWKAILLGGGFRVTTAVSLHGDFSRFGRVEIVKAESLIGPDAPSTLLHDLTDRIAAEFRKGGRFTDVSVVNAYEPRDTTLDQPAAGPGDFRTADSLDAPMRPAGDLAAMDGARDAAALEEAAPNTLVVTSAVIDYARGNKAAQLLFLNLGNALVTLRLSLYDKSTGAEIGRSVISSDNSSQVVPSMFSTRTALSGLAEGLVDQVTRRKVAAER